MNSKFAENPETCIKKATTILIIDDELLSQDMDDLLVGGNVHRLRGLHRALDVHRAHLAVLHRHAHGEALLEELVGDLAVVGGQFGVVELSQQMVLERFALDDGVEEMLVLLLLFG